MTASDSPGPSEQVALSQQTTRPERDPVPAAVQQEGLWADDLHPGQTFTSEPFKLTTEDVTSFASLFDPQAFHLHADGAADTFFGRLVASGWHTAAITMRLLVQALPIATGIVGAGSEVTWPSAAVPGDVLRLTVTVDDVIWSASRPGRASIKVSHSTTNQVGEIRQRSTARLIAWAKPGTAPGDVDPTE